MIKLRGLSKIYHTPQRVAPATLILQIAAGEFVPSVGKSGIVNQPLLNLRCALTSQHPHVESNPFRV